MAFRIYSKQPCSLLNDSTYATHGRMHCHYLILSAPEIDASSLLLISNEILNIGGLNLR
eukprot:CAMPEP_0195517928 /NCGR_PEP_ID=MMETSP0794_2-20130614/11828_1 /TAXON_ID=515487 /ORGANISM="Stephanopyxis turris, Strain CCMP 815" /LENGTH=58 /DNA_ID=CAMNT_0040646809 /DNA_START=34 /DNA_END=210 /DNA_ORIENTATION=-